MKYRTIVCDPPWDQGSSGGYSWRRGRPSGNGRSLPYPTMTVEQIGALPVSDLAERHAHLYLWTTQRYLRDAFDVVAGWGFRYSCTLVWCKEPHGFNPGGTFGSTTEFVLFVRRGVAKANHRVQRQWFRWPRGEHSAKPEQFLDLVESVSPAPRLEMFARRNRLGWDTWGDQCHQHIEIAR